MQYLKQETPKHLPGVYSQLKVVNDPESENMYLRSCDITKTRLYNFDPFKPPVYIVKLGFTGVYIIFYPKAVLTSTNSLCFEQKNEKLSEF